MLGVTFILIRGVRETARTNLIMVAIKLAVLTFFVVVIFAAAFNADHMTPFAPEGRSGVVDAAAIIFFACIGFDAVSTGAEEVRNPRKDLPLAIVGSLLFCTAIYILVSVAAVGSLDARRCRRATRRWPRRSTRAPASRGRRASSRSARSSRSPACC